MLFFFPNPPPPIPLSPFLSRYSSSSSSSTSFCLHDSSYSFSKVAFGFPRGSTDKTPFLGAGLTFTHDRALGFVGQRERPFYRPLHPVTAVVKRRKELPFDSVIQRDKKLKLVLKIRKILVSQPDRIMNLRDLGRYRKELGLTRKRRFIALLKRFPGVFEIIEEGVYSLRFKLSPQAERIYLEELKLRNEMEDALVIKLRKLLMMSLQKRILLEKIAHLMTDLGLPPDFRSTICGRYPQYFMVVPTDRGPALELTHWDPELAVSAVEASEAETRLKEIQERDLIIERPLKFRRVKLPKGLNLSKGEMRRISQFRDMPYISPYSDFSELRPGTPEKEKHACGVIHEILSLTVEKKTLVDHLTHFREEFKFSQQLRGMLIRHPDMFYVSLKGDRDSVFLRDAYRDSQLIEKDKLSLIKEKMRGLVAVPRFSGMRTMKTDDGDAESMGDKRSGADFEDDWSDAEGLLDEGLRDEFDGDTDYEDEDADPQDFWSDDDDDVPSYLNSDATSSGQKTTAKPVYNSSGKEEKVLLPVYPDGRPREQW
ncbi:unnamed protein product [Spirodela intermedia]|uniref:PORR domain-containing protein n=1 Tax=Spirodela intermedia TaxID=51605 RepID=A0A7I8J5B5_SPIIN|nr:unnamed protein product [Spirodela intermedia]CAA6665230.1 unnamed protein product [Spirodela intermedia]